MKNIKVSVLTIAMLTAVGALADGNAPSTTGAQAGTNQPASAGAPQASEAPANPPVVVKVQEAPAKPADASKADASAAPVSDASKPAVNAGFFASIKGFFGSAYTTVANRVSDTGTYINENRVKSAVIAAAAVAAGVAIWKNRKQIYKAIVNNPKTSAAVAVGIPALAYAYSAGYVKLPSFGSKAADTNAPAANTAAQAPVTTK